ncbi:acetyltransferase family protein, partial [Vibrio parahaemolyticus AQ3810]
KRMVVSSKI